MTLEDGELLSRLRIGVCLVIALRRLTLPREIGGQRPPGAPPDITGHLTRTDSNVGSDARLRVEQAVVETGRTLVGVVATVHLTGSDTLVLVTIVIEDAEIHCV